MKRAMVLLTLILLISMSQTVLGAVSATRGWQAKLGPVGANGTADVSVISTGAGSIGIKLAKLRPSTLLPVAIYKGLCASVGAVLFRLPAIKTTSSGAATRTSSLTAAQARLVLAATQGTGKIAIRVGTGSSVKCGPFAVRSRLDPQIVVQRFYDWYIAATSRSALYTRPELTPGFVKWFKAWSAPIDPIACAQDYPSAFHAGTATIVGGKALVKVTSELGNAVVTLTLGPSGWKIAAVECGFGATTDHQPDGRIRLDTHGYPGKTTTYPGPFVGDNTYNATGVNQDVTVKNFSELDGAFYTFEISIQNDGRLTDQFTIKATASPGTSWAVTYWHDTTDVTAAVEQGTYLTPPLATGAADDVTAKITLGSGGDVNRLVTITSSADPALVDAVSFGYKESACGC